jgi:hypothetical protein
MPTIPAQNSVSTVGKATTGSAAVGQEAMVRRFTQTAGLILAGTFAGKTGWIDSGGTWHDGPAPP